jgi:hypothetical protein
VGTTLAETITSSKENAMATAKTSRGLKQDRGKVGAGQKHEVSYEAGKTGATPSKVRAAVKKVGNSRAKVEAELKRGR